MFKNYFKVAIRNLLKRKVFTFINIFGLAVAIAVSMLLFSTAFREMSFDNFHDDLDQLYAIYFHENGAEKVDLSTNLPMPLIPQLLEEVPSIVQATRIHGSGVNVEVDGQLLSISLDYIDPDFFNIIKCKVVKGEQQPLGDKSAITLSERTAARVFGKEDPIGQTLRLTDERGKREYIVSAVFENMPTNSSFNLGMLTHIENSPDYNTDNWDNYSHHGFVKIGATTTQQQVEEQLQRYTRKQFAEEIEGLKESGAQADERGDLLALRLYPMSKLRFASHINGVDSINKIFPFALLAIGLFILAIACINFVNLTLGNSITRSTEVGLRKVFGAKQRQLVGQFWGETVLVILIAALFGLMLVQWALPHYNTALQGDIQINSPFVLSALALILVITGLAAGTYPAWVLSRFQAARVLKRELSIQKSGWLRSLLVVVQFVISILLICSTLVINQQIKFMRNKPLGFNKEEVLSIPIGGEIDGRKALNLMRNKMEAHPNIISMSGTSRNLGLGRDHSTYTSIIGFGQNDKMIETYWMAVDYDYVKTLELKLLEGRPFDRNRMTDTSIAVIINESLAAKIEERPIVGSLLHTNPRSEVIGVVENFNFQPLKKKVEPLSLAMDNKFRLTYILVKMADRNIPQTIQELKSAWQEIAPRSEFQASFLDENTDRLYKEEDIMSTVFTFAAILTILLSCLGLFAIAVMNIMQRTKEIGIRKVLGASVSNIVGMLSKDILRLVLIAGMIAIPLSWMAMKRWLQDFYYRIDMPLWAFGVGILLVLFIAFTTVSFQSIRAALANPIKALKHE